MEKAAKNIDEYIRGFPPAVQDSLQKIRAAIREAAPGAAETISYQMPAFKLNGILVYFAAHKNHIGFYPTSSGIAAFKKEISGYQWSKGAIQFLLDKPLPLELVKRIVEFRMKEDQPKKVKSKPRSSGTS